MKKYGFSLLCLLLFQTCAKSPKSSTTQSAGTGIRETETKTIVLNMPPLQMEINPRQSAWITSFQYGGQEMIAQPNVHPQIYGSTFWPSPQSEWKHDYVFGDSIRYTGKIEKNILLLTSPAEPKTGYQFSREITLNPGDTSIQITYILKNISAEPKKVAPWEITRVPAGGLSFFPQGEPNTLRGNLKVHDAGEIIWHNYLPTTITGHQKVFADGQEGWLAHVQNGLLFIKKFPDIGHTEAAPGEQDVEIYANDQKTYIELENQGVYQTLAPGESTSWPVTWYLRKLPPQIVAKEENAELVKYVREVIK